MALRINLTSVMVDDQRKTLEFYMRVLGFVRKTEIPMGDWIWLTLVSPDAPDAVELVLENSLTQVRRTGGGLGWARLLMYDCLATGRLPGVHLHRRVPRLGGWSAHRCRPS